MTVIDKFEARRARGIVWVCDLASSSKYLNNNESAEALEKFLERFLYVSLVFVEAARGEYIKWTGDGFLAWFETPLYRDAGSIAGRVFNAAWYLSFLVNITQLGIESRIKFKIRHAVTYEHDGLHIDLSHSKTKSSTDVLGRAVVLAFRLSSIAGEFPSIVTQRNLVKESPEKMTFKKLVFSKEERLKYFKDETWGINDIYISGNRPHRKKGIRAVVKQMRSAVALKTEGPNRGEFTSKLIDEMEAGPEWCKAVRRMWSNFIHNQLVVPLKEILPKLEEEMSRQTTQPSENPPKP
jgi:class 3 adenylate cyclase